MVYDPIMLGIDGPASGIVMSQVSGFDGIGKLRHYLRISANLKLPCNFASYNSNHLFKYDSIFRYYIVLPPPNLFSTDVQYRAKFFAGP